jgi:type VI secretion system secreted protein VgrG
MRPDSDTSWFTIKLNGNKNFRVYEFSGFEAVHEPYEFTVELVSTSPNEDITSYLGREASLAIADVSGASRYVHGLVREMEQLHTANSFTHYRCVIVPKLWFLGQKTDHRIFQHLRVQDIVLQVLREQGIAGDDAEFKLSKDYEEREYCVQYGETGLHFISRLCEEEGIYFYFEHHEYSHKLCFCDAAGGPPIEGEHDLRFYPGSGHSADTAVISRVNLSERVNSDSSTYREWNFEKPRLDLETHAKEEASAPTGMNLETYQFPHLYQLRKSGEIYVDIQIKRQIALNRWIECESDASRFLPGYTFSIHEHPKNVINAKWWLISVSHHGEQPGVLEQEAPDRGLTYKSNVKAIPNMTRYVPPLKHLKNRIEALQSAVVTGPQGEEVFSDQYGRVKVQFHWDREGRHDETTTCWVRVADTWAGVNFGFIQIPRIGQEVMVEFMEGDPDRPVITGRVYNEINMPPWNLPEQKTLSGIQSREFKAGRRNQLLLDDMQGQIQAQLSSDHDLSQLNLGYITRINHIEGRKDFRGEGFELRADSWGSLRAGKGLFISTDARSHADKHQKDIREAMRNLDGAVKQHKSQLELAVKHEAQKFGEHQQPLSNTLEKQNAELRGSGQPHGEFTAPQLLISSPSGIAATAFESIHLHSRENTCVTAGSHISLASNKSFLATAIKMVSIFAHSLGIKLFAGKGKVEIQAQSDDLDVIADKVLQLISARERVHISAPKEILLTAGDSYIKISKDGIENGMSGAWAVHAASHGMLGSKTMPYLAPTLPAASLALSTATDLATPATPAAAPATINLSGMQNDFDEQWSNSFPNGVSEEHGGTFVSDASGNLSMVNPGGGEQGSFSPNLNVGADQTVQGVSHTHPYDASEGGYTGISMSGGDAGYVINNHQNIIVAQSGTDQFMYMRTDASPTNVDETKLNNDHNARIAQLIAGGKDFSEASKIAAKETAEAHGLAYYEGSNGILQRVYP